MLVVADVAVAARTDEVVLYNGNTITGEVKSLKQGKLEYKTDRAGTLYLEWDYIHFLSSNTFFEVENNRGEFFYGTLGPGKEARKFLVIGEDETIELEMDRIIEIHPIQKSFWQRIDGSVDFGLNYVSADDSLQYSLNGKATYRQPKFSESITLSSIETHRGDEDKIFRDSLAFNYTRYHTKRRFGSGSLIFSRNSELGIDLRTEIGYSLGRYIVLTNRTRLSTRVGASVTREKPVGDEPQIDTAWGLIAGRYHFFLYNFPKTDISVDLSVQPGISDWPRTRADLSIAIRREVITDFTVNLSAYDSYDSDPPSDVNHDYGLVASLGWTF